MTGVAITLAATLAFVAPPGDDAKEAPATERRAPTTQGPAYADKIATRPPEQRDQAAMEQLFASGAKAYREGRFEAALEAFVAAYEAYPNPSLIYSAGSCHRRLFLMTGDATQREFATRRYTDYLLEEPHGKYSVQAQEYLNSLRVIEASGMDEEVLTRLLVAASVDGAMVSVDGGESTDAPAVLSVDPGPHEVTVEAPGYHPFTQRIEVPEGTTPQVQAELRQIDARLSVRGPSGAAVLVDGLEVARLPMNDPVPLAPGAYEVVVAKSGYETYRREVTVERDEDVALDAPMRVSTKRVLAYTLMGLGGGAAVASGVFTGLALDAQRRALDLNDQREGDGIPEDAWSPYDSWRDKRDTYTTTAIATGIAGGALLITGGILMAIDRPETGKRETPGKTPKRTARIIAAPVLSPTSVGATARLKF